MQTAILSIISAVGTLFSAAAVGLYFALKFPNILIIVAIVMFIVIVFVSAVATAIVTVIVTDCYVHIVVMFYFFVIVEISLC